MTGIIRTFKIKKVSFVSGLLWETPVDNALLRDFRKKSEKNNIYYASRKIGKNRTQLGMISRDEGQGIERGMCSFAGTLSNIIKKPTWIAAVTINTKDMAFVVARYGEILAGMDCIDRTEIIHEKFVNTITMFLESGDNFDDIYCPKSWNIPDSKEIVLSNIISRKDFNRCKSVICFFSGTDILKFHKRHIKQLVCIASVLSVVGGGYYSYDSYKQKQEQQQIVNTKYIQPPHEWESELFMDEQLSEWDLRYEEIPVVYEGWDLKAVSFTRGMTNLTYRRNEMLTANDFSQKANTYFKVQPVFDKTGNEAMLSLSFPVDKDIDRKEDLLSKKDAIIRFYSYFQHIGANNVKIKRMEFNLPPVPVSNDPNVIYKWDNVNWQKYSWVIDVNVPPSVMFCGLKRLPGLRVSKISTTDIKNSQWKIEGEFYAKNN